MQDQQQRNTELKRIQHYLATDEGQYIMDELKAEWDPINILGDTPQKTGYNCGLRDAFKFMEMLQNGDLIHE